MPSTLDAPPSREAIDRLREAPVTPMAVRAALGLGVFTVLGRGPMTVHELAAAVGGRDGHFVWPDLLHDLSAPRRGTKEACERQQSPVIYPL